MAVGGRAFDLLHALAERPGQLVGKHALMDLVWPGLVVEENNLALEWSDALLDERERQVRIDNGRKSSEVRGLEGIDDVQRTLRARFSATWQVAPAWKLASGLNVDLLGHGGGNVLDLGATHDRRWSEATTWSLRRRRDGGRRQVHRSWYGVTEAGSAARGKPVYVPGAGWRDISFSSGWRTEIGQDWIVLTGFSIGRLLGPAAASPLTTS